MIKGIHNFQEAKGFIMQRKMVSILLVGLFQFTCCGGKLWIKHYNPNETIADALPFDT
jgi:hypothetical protein